LIGTILMLGAAAAAASPKLIGRSLGEASDDIEVWPTTYHPGNDTPERSPR
jgi:hypothetical protein